MFEAASGAGRRAWLARAVVGLSLVALVLSKRHDLARSWHELRLVSGIGLATLLGVTALQVLARALVVRSTLPDLEVRRALMVSEASVGSQNSLVGGGLVAGGLRVSMLRSWGIPGETIAVSLFASSVFAQYAVWSLALICSAAAVLRGVPGSLPGTVTVAAILVLTGITVTGWLLVYRPALGNLLARSGDRAVGAIRQRVRRLPELHLVERAADGRESARRFLREQGWRTFALSVASQLMLAVVLVVSLRAFHVGEHLVTIPEVLTAFALVRVAASVTPAPGGVGVTEAGLAHLLSSAGGPTSKVLAAVLTYRACTYLLPIPVGAASILLWQRLLKRSRMTPGAPVPA
jgi:putative heme transporter